MSTIQAQEAAHVLWHVGDKRGLPPGGFTEALLVAIGKADAWNRGRLFVAFPGLVQAMQLSFTEAGRDELARIAGGAV